VRACVLERHGTVTCGRSLEEAYFLTESLERLAKTETILATVNF
jgi:ribulose-5-phosphate 4-epimerase/fuculose-1-phosphate aldolase